MGFRVFVRRAFKTIAAAEAFVVLPAVGLVGERYRLRKQLNRVVRLDHRIFFE